MTLTCSRSKIPTCMLHAPPRPKFSSVSLYVELFLSYGAIFGKVHQMTPNDLDMFKVKTTSMHVICTPEAQIFVRFTLWWAVFELWCNFRKSAANDPNDLDMFKVKNTNMNVTYTPEAQIFIPFRSTMSRFWVMDLFSEKCTKWPQMTLICLRSKIPTCMLHTPPGPKFSSVSLYDNPFSS